MSEQSTPEIRHEPDQHRWAAYVDGAEAGYAEYELLEDPPRLVLTHTVVGDDFGGRGVASGLARTALDATREEGERSVVPQCSFRASYLDKHPEYADLVAG